PQQGRHGLVRDDERTRLSRSPPDLTAVDARALADRRGDGQRPATRSDASPPAATAAVDAADRLHGIEPGGSDAAPVPVSAGRLRQDLGLRGHTTPGLLYESAAGALSL